jgi:hypothetical protein
MTLAPLPVDLERRELANQLRLEVDKIRYQWVPPTHLDNEKLKLLIKLLKG